MRTESDSLGPVTIEDGRLWGPQTQRAVNNFDIGDEGDRWGRSVIEHSVT